MKNGSGIATFCLEGGFCFSALVTVAHDYDLHDNDLYGKAIGSIPTVRSMPVTVSPPPRGACVRSQSSTVAMICFGAGALHGASEFIQFYPSDPEGPARRIQRAAKLACAAANPARRPASSPPPSQDSQARIHCCCHYLCCSLYAVVPVLTKLGCKLAGVWTEGARVFAHLANAHIPSRKSL
jgi:hypothetical protein